MIYKILTAEQWADLQAKGETPGAPIDVADGFVHFSAADQVRETAARHFAGQEGLWLLAYPDEMAGLRWEPSRGGALFPHLYAPLRLAEMQSATPIGLGAEGHIFPAEIP
ncbi:MAG: DUF952 domain-containing protein [Pseudomonadota bacterium]